MLTRRDLLKHFGTMTAAAIALPMVDLDKLIWTPKPIITVPALPAYTLTPPTQWWVFEHGVEIIEGVVKTTGRWIELPPGDYPPAGHDVTAIGSTVFVGPTAFATATAIGIVR